MRNYESLEKILRIKDHSHHTAEYNKRINADTTIRFPLYIDSEKNKDRKSVYDAYIIS